MTGSFRRVCILLAALVGLGMRPAAADSLPPVGHVFLIVLENEGFDTTFGPKSPAPYLSQDLVKQGVLLTHYYGIGHYSLDNYLAMISGQAPNPATQEDCEIFSPFILKGIGEDGQAIGRGCVYPTEIKTIADQLTAAKLRWRGYMEDMGNKPSREAATCGHPVIGTRDRTQRADPTDQYATRHDPFVYFHSIIDTPDCAANVLPLSALPVDLKQIETTPNYLFITPNLCHDGHDGGEPGKLCADKKQPGGLVSADQFLRQWVLQILASPAFQKDGLLIVTFDEADIDGPSDPHADATSCCNEQWGPNIVKGDKIEGVVTKGPGLAGPGGGRIGAVAISPFIKPGTVSDRPYNHYALLRTVEDLFHLGHLGYAGQAGLNDFGGDVFSR